MPMRPRSGSAFIDAPQVVWSSSSADGALKLKTWQPCGLTPDMTWLDGAVLAGGIHGLEDQQHGVGVLRVEHVLLPGEPLDAVGEQGLGVRSSRIEPVQAGS